MKRQYSEWEKIFADEATDKGSIFKIYEQFMQLNIMWFDQILTDTLSSIE